MSADRLPSTSGARHALLWLLALGYGAVLAFVVFWPSPIDQPVAGLLDRAIAEMHERGVPDFVDYGLIEAVANVLLFIPVGLFFGLAVPLRWWPVALLLGPALSGLIELAQRELLAERYATLQDVVVNSIGATIGVLIAVSLRAMIAARDRQVVRRHTAIAARTRVES